MSCTPYGLAVAINGKEEGKTKKNMHPIWSGLACPRAKILRKDKKNHTCHMVRPWPSSAKKRKNKHCRTRRLNWPWFPMGQNLMEKPKIVDTPYGLAVIGIGQKKMKNKKCHACCLVLPGPSSAKKTGKTNKFIPQPLGLSFASHLLWTLCRLHAVQFRI